MVSADDSTSTLTFLRYTIKKLSNSASRSRNVKLTAPHYKAFPNVHKIWHHTKSMRHTRLPESPAYHQSCARQSQDEDRHSRFLCYTETPLQSPKLVTSEVDYDNVACITACILPAGTLQAPAGRSRSPNWTCVTHDNVINPEPSYALCISNIPNALQQRHVTGLPNVLHNYMATCFTKQSVLEHTWHKHLRLVLLKRQLWTFALGFRFTRQRATVIPSRGVWAAIAQSV
jgi:hypothetical protein